MTGKRVFLCLATALVACAVHAPAFAAGPAPDAKSPSVKAKAGNISALLPTAHVDRGTGKAASSAVAKKGDDVIWNDVVRTDKGGRARITLLDQSILSLGSQAQLKIVQHDARAQQTSLELGYGRVRAEVTKIVNQNGSFQLRTPTAVAGVIGTEFVTSSSVGATEFVCLSGTVSVGSIDPKVTDKEACGPGQYVKVEGSKAPSKAKPATAEQLQQAIQETLATTISAFAPSSILAGTIADVVANGTHMDGIGKVAVSGTGVEGSLGAKGTATTANVHLVVAADATPGPRIVTLTKPNGQATSAILTIIAAPSAAGGGLKPFHDTFESERQSALAGLTSFAASLQQTADSGAQQAQNPAFNAASSASLNQLNDAIAGAQQAINQATTKAIGDFDTRAAAAAGNAQGITAAFSETNTALLAEFKTTGDGLGSTTATLAQSIGNTLGGAGAAAGEKSVEAGDDFSFTTTGGGNWSLCSAGSASCTPISGFSASGPEFAANTCSLRPGDYVAQLTSDSGASTRYLLHVLAPAYDNPSAQITNLANAYSSLQPQGFLKYFDATSFGGYAQLSENIRRTFQSLSSMNINLRPSQAQVTCNEATVRADWEQNYSFQENPQVVYHQTEQLTARMVRVSGKGWFIVDFQGDNGTVQGLPPGPASTDAALPELTIDSIDTAGGATLPGPLVSGISRAGGVSRGVTASTTGVLPIAPGVTSFVATVRNKGKIALTQPVDVLIELTDAGNRVIGSVQVPIPVSSLPLAPGQSVQVRGSINVPQLAPGTPAQLVANANPGCKVQLQNCGATTTTTREAVIGQVDLVIRSLDLDTSKSTTLSGQTRNLVMQIANVGTSASASNDTVSCTLTGALGASNIVTTAPIASVAAGQTQTAQIGFTVPANRYGVDTIACALAKDPFEQNTANNSLSFTTTVAPNIDLVPQSHADVTLQMGNTLAGLTVSIKNAGLDDAAAGWNAVYKLNGTAAATQTGPAVAGGATVNVVFSNVTAPQLGTPPQDVIVPAEVDVNVNNAVVETNTANNAATFNARLLDFTFRAYGTTTGVVGRPFQAPGVCATIPYPYLLPATVTLAPLPPGTTLVTAGKGQANIAGTPTTAGNSTADCSATVGSVTKAAPVPAVFTIVPEIAVTQSGSTSIAAGGSGTLQIAVAGGLYPVSVTLALPSGLATSDPATQTLSAAGTLSWNLSAGPAATAGSYTVALHATDAGVPNPGAGAGVYAVNPGNVNATATVAVAATPIPADYSLGTVSIAGHEAPPFTGANALVVGEDLTITIPVQNTGNVTQTGDITVSLDCVGQCNNPLIATVAAPAGGQSVNAVFTYPASKTSQVRPAQYIAIATLSTALPQASTSNDSVSLPVDAVDFSLAPGSTTTPTFTIGSSSPLPVVVSEAGPTTLLPVTLTAAATVSGVTVTAPSAGVPAGTQVLTVAVPSSTTASGDTITVTGTAHGVTKTATIPVRFASASTSITITDVSYPGNSSSFPASVDPSGTANQVVFQIGGSFAGPANVSVGTVTGFTTSLNINTANPGDQILLTVAAQPGAPSTVTAIPLTVSVPNTTVSASYTLYVIAQAAPDLLIVSAVPSGANAGRNFTASPWLAGETVQFDVTVKNQGAVGTSNQLFLAAYVNGQTAGFANATSALSPGATTVVTLQVTAPDAAYTGPTAVEFFVTPDVLESNYANNSLVNTLNLSDWSIRITGAGTQASPVLFTSGQTTNDAAINIGASGGGTPLVSFSLAPTLISTNFSASVQNATLTSGNSFQSLVHLAETAGAAAPPNGPYYVQVVATIPIPPGALVAPVQRQATIFINVNSATPSYPVTLNSSANNYSDGATGGAARLQINGALPVFFNVTPLVPASTCSTCNKTSNSVDLTFSDDDNIVASVQQLKAAAVSAPATVGWSAARNPDGTINAVPAVSTVGAQAIAITSAINRYNPVSTPVNPIGQLLFNVGDLALTPATTCLSVKPGGTAPLSIQFTTINGFNLPSVSWQWQFGSDTAGITVTPATGSSTYSGGSYSALPTFTFTNANASATTASQYGTALFDVTLTDPQTRLSVPLSFYVDLDLSATGTLCTSAGAANGGGGGIQRGVYGSGGSLTHASRISTASTTHAPELNIAASDVTFSPSMPKAGDTVDVRFRIANSGNADATRVPVAFQVNGVTVAQDTFDVPAGHTVLGGLQWTNAQASGGGTPASRTSIARRGFGGVPGLASASQPVAFLVIDPAGAVHQQTNRQKSVALAHFAVQGSSAEEVASSVASSRALLEVGDSGCIGFRFASGAGSACGGTDLEVSVVDLAQARYSLAAQVGIADLGPAAHGALDLHAVAYSPEVPAVAGHTYAVQLSGGRTATFTIRAIHNPAQAGARGQQVFRGGQAANAIKRVGGGTGPVETGDTAGTGHGAEPKVTFEILYSAM